MEEDADGGGVGEEAGLEVVAEAATGADFVGMGSLGKAMSAGGGGRPATEVSVCSVEAVFPRAAAGAVAAVAGGVVIVGADSGTVAAGLVAAGVEAEAKSEAGLGVAGGVAAADGTSRLVLGSLAS